MNELRLVAPHLYLPTDVAVVGSSGTLLSEKKGKDIDEHDYIIRFNRAPTDGFEEHVGSRTSLRVVNNHVIQNTCIKDKGFSNQPKDFVRNMKEGNLLYFGPCMSAWENRSLNVDVKNVNCYRFMYERIAFLQTWVNFYTRKNLSVGTGLICVLIVSGIKPVLYGVDLEERCRDHYFEKRPLTPGSSHDILQEKRLLQEFLEEGDIFLG